QFIFRWHARPSVYWLFSWLSTQRFLLLEFQGKKGFLHSRARAGCRRRASRQRALRRLPFPVGSACRLLSGRACTRALRDAGHREEIIEFPSVCGWLG